MILITFIILFSSLASASETKTECPMIKQMEKRVNPKAHPPMMTSNMKVNSLKSVKTSVQ